MGFNKLARKYGQKDWVKRAKMRQFINNNDYKLRVNVKR